MNTYDDIEELEQPFEQIRSVSATGGSDGSDTCTLSIEAPRYTCCAGNISVTAKTSDACPLSSITLTDPAGKTTTGTWSVTVNYSATSEDCGKTITFTAQASSVSGTVTADISVVKAAFVDLENTDGASDIKASTGPGGVAGQYFFANTKFTGKVVLTPAPSTEDDIPYDFRLSQFQNTKYKESTITSVTPRTVSTSESSKRGRDTGFDDVPQTVTYEYTNGTVVIKSVDEPGSFIPQATFDKLSTATTSFLFNIYMEYKCKGEEGSLWKTLGKLYWDWNGGLSRNASGQWAPDGVIIGNHGEPSSDTPLPPEGN